MIRALIVEDDPRHAATLQSMLRQSPNPVEVLGVCANISTAAEAIRTQSPNLLFLDIDLEWGENGFDLLALFPVPDFAVIFTTQHTSTHNAINAIRASALDFLPKPLLRQELQAALARLNGEDYTARLATLSENIKGGPGKMKSVWLADLNGKTLVDLADIVYCKSNNVWTHFHLARPVHGKNLFTSSESIKYWEQLFGGTTILRVHNQFLVNLRFVRRWQRLNGGMALRLENGEDVPVSRSRRGEVETRIEHFRKG